MWLITNQFLVDLLFAAISKTRGKKIPQYKDFTFNHILIHLKLKTEVLFQTQYYISTPLLSSKIHK